MSQMNVSDLMVIVDTLNASLNISNRLGTFNYTEDSRRDVLVKLNVICNKKKFSIAEDHHKSKL